MLGIDGKRDENVRLEVREGYGCGREGVLGKRAMADAEGRG